MTTRVIIHAACADSLQRARNNANNLLLSMPEAEVEIVVNAGAVAAALAQAHNTDALLRVCENTLKNTHQQAGTQQVVPAAIVYLIEKQQEGWVYVRA
ncbi:hypothetical protein ACBP46_07425 [Paenalcaligenes hominis]|uniref:DsrE family protein n=1 Tax=Paenalcaligenes hominis TaxID=643674 RepID=UPI003525F774